MKTTLMIILLLIGVVTGNAQSKTTAAPTPSVVKVPTLTANQKEALYKLNGAREQEGAQSLERLKDLERQSTEILLQDTLDKASLQAVQEQTLQLIGKMFVMKDQLMRDAIEILTIEQREYLRQVKIKPNAPTDLMDLITLLYEQLK